MSKTCAKMGGTFKLIPITYILMIVGTLALTGVGIPGTSIGFAGFFSKDAIIEAAYAAGAEGIMRLPYLRSGQV